MEAKKFVVGKNAKNFPDWFNEHASAGRLKVVYDDDGNVDNIVVSNPTRRIVAHVGDTIMLMKSGLTVLTEEKAKRYKVQQNPKTQAENSL